jgi:hypothetical protein
LVGLTNPVDLVTLRDVHPFTFPRLSNHDEPLRMATNIRPTR